MDTDLNLIKEEFLNKAMEKFDKKLMKNSEQFARSISRNKQRPQTSTHIENSRGFDKENPMGKVYGKNPGINFKVDCYSFFEHKPKKSHIQMVGHSKSISEIPRINQKIK